MCEVWDYETEMTFPQRSRFSWLVSWCFDPSQPRRITSGLEAGLGLSTAEVADVFQRHFTGPQETEFMLLVTKVAGVH